jgi:hypothetical protein
MTAAVYAGTLTGRRILLATLGLLALALILDGSSTHAQKLTASACDIPFFRGAAQPGGATVELTVVNVGMACRLVHMFGDSDDRIPASALWVVDQPQHGTVTFPAPNVAAYTVNAGYTGPDTFSYVGRGANRQGGTATLLVTVLVTVVSDSDRLTMVPPATVDPRGPKGK